MDDESGIHTRFKMRAPFLNERTRRLFTAADAAALGRGGIATVARATGVSRRAIATGWAELNAAHAASAHVVRRPGLGLQRAVQSDQTLQYDQERFIAPMTRGAPESPLRWT